MAKFDFIHIVWINKPAKKELAKINKLFSKLDRDFPENGFTEDGFYGVWRKPCLTAKMIADILHCYGYANKFRYVEDIYTKANDLEDKSIQENYTSHVYKTYQQYAEELMGDWEMSIPQTFWQKRSSYRYSAPYYYYEHIRLALKKFSRRFV